MPADEDDHDLSPNDDELYGNEKVVSMHSLEDIHFVVDASIVVLVENLHPDEGIEY